MHNKTLPWQFVFILVVVLFLGIIVVKKRVDIIVHFRGWDSIVSDDDPEYIYGIVRQVDILERLQAVRALARCHTKASSVVLMRLTNDSSDFVRLEILASIKEMDSTMALDVLHAMSSDRRSDIRSDVESKILEISRWHNNRCTTQSK